MAFDPVDQARIDQLTAQVSNLQAQMVGVLARAGETDLTPGQTLEQAAADHEARIAALEALHP